MQKHKRAVLYDLDSSLANTWHRQPMVDQIRAGKATWDDYSLACEADEPFPGTVRLTQMTWLHWQNHIVSGRSVLAVQQTHWWLRKHAVQYDFLKLRAEGDHRPNAAPKIDYIRELQASGVIVDLFVEDWKETADEITAATEVPCLIPNPCYPPGAPEAREVGTAESAIQ